MSDRRAELVAMTEKFVDAFNRMNLDDIVNTFAANGVYEDSNGGRHEGHDAIRAAVE